MRRLTSTGSDMEPFSEMPTQEPSERSEAESDAWSRGALEGVLPSMYRTVSTMCSSVRGPAMSPVFVTCPVMRMVVLSDFATSWRRVVLRRTCATDPGAEGQSSASIVWMESMIIAA